MEIMEITVPQAKEKVIIYQTTQSVSTLRAIILTNLLLGTQKTIPDQTLLPFKFGMSTRKTHL